MPLEERRMARSSPSEGSNVYLAMGSRYEVNISIFLGVGRNRAEVVHSRIRTLDDLHQRAGGMVNFLKCISKGAWKAGKFTIHSGNTG